ncbi:PDF receptor isoform X3 [Anopheles arabiensis]|uniref:PDF receptor isoform X3 n=1 Tax=Anopheles arabiensis TaxID=7173 RepID=UPI001AAD42A3|nr:PDF receptor isoform X3 [Anopheles arabiensis]
MVSTNGGPSTVAAAVAAAGTAAATAAAAAAAAAAGSASTLSTADATQLFINTTLDSCALKYEEFVIPNTVPYCNWTWDSILCWPPTPANLTIRQRCPPAHGIDTSKFAERRCSAEGQWEGKPGSPPTLHGWTNYTPCYSPEVIQLFRKLYASGSDDEANDKFDIAERTRTLETVGFSLSLVALIVSLVIFCKFRGLRNNRTRIHKNLFVAMVIQVVIRLTVYIDQAIIRSGGKKGNESSRQGIDNTLFLCEASYVLLEYARTCMFMWMFIEGLYLHNVVTVTVFQGRFPHKLYAIVGWGGPLILTVIWAIITAQYIRQQKCWWGYNLTPYYWILEGPRLAAVVLNFIFLLNIIRVLIVKLRQSHTSDVEQVRKAVRAAVVLVPLLGITNILNMTQAPLDKTALEFAIWSYVTHFLSSFQGFFIALLYCFLNGEVRTALMKSISVYLSLRGHHDWAIRRQSLFSAGYPTAPINETPHAGEPQRSRNAASNNLLAGAASSNNHHTANGGMAGGNANGFRCGWFSRCFLVQNTPTRPHRSRPRPSQLYSIFPTSCVASLCLCVCVLVCVCILVPILVLVSFLNQRVMAAGGTRPK